MNRYLLAFGSNLGNLENNCEQALLLIKTFFHVVRRSEQLRVPPLASEKYDCSNHGTYLNFVCEGTSELTPLELYKRIVDVENTLGHCRQEKWRPRQIDIDILFAAANDSTYFETCTPVIWTKGHPDLPDFRVPHAEFWQRDFLVAMVCNELGISQNALTKHCQEFARLNT